MFPTTDDSDRKRWIVETMCAVPLSVAAAGIRGVVGWNGIAALAICTVPLLYCAHGQEEATSPLGCFRSSPISTLASPSARHFHQLEVPEHVTAMMERFIQVAVTEPRV